MTWVKSNGAHQIRTQTTWCRSGEDFSLGG